VSAESARVFMNRNRERAKRELEESKDKPRSHKYMIAQSILNFIDAYEIEVGYRESITRRHFRTLVVFYEYTRDFYSFNIPAYDPTITVTVTADQVPKEVHDFIVSGGTYLHATCDLNVDDPKDIRFSHWEIG